MQNTKELNRLKDFISDKFETLKTHLPWTEEKKSFGQEFSSRLSSTLSNMKSEIADLSKKVGKISEKSAEQGLSAAKSVASQAKKSKGKAGLGLFGLLAAAIGLTILFRGKCCKSDNAGVTPDDISPS